ncbi:inositol monophosphatase family protein [Aquirufa nivalisilvae]|uniref:inositol monophosphatase family protein n=1 Tax=Aquirufa nivalisilvae TaxID=2516557 RepID=UPI001032B635|nr:inositol monophosphatase family protein [Aquirufa nivalisilvae]TBH72306.1 inositol monophosphatase [Aquirufa nivalisilvae]
MADLEKILEQSLPLVREVGQWIQSMVNQIAIEQIQYKGKNDLVSFVDQTAEVRLKEGLAAIFSEAGFIAEESASDFSDVGDGYYWVIDPLDGTTNFLHQLPIYAVSVGLIYQKQPVLGMIYEPNRDELFYAVQGAGAHMNGLPIQVSSQPTLEKSLLATGFPYHDFSYQDKYLTLLKELMQKSHGLRRMGAAAIDLAYTACGRFEGFFEANLKPWDVAAGKIIIEEAGGKVTNFTGGPDVVFTGQIIGAGAIFEEFLGTLQMHWEN